MYFNNKYSGKKNLEEREKRKRKWKKIDRSILERLILTALSEPDAILKYMQRWEEIINSNQDWKQYLPPNKETFLSVIGLDRNSLSGDKKEVERTIREKYRYLEKTAQVNLAYSVLKNTSQREDYLWLLENHEMLNTLFNLFKKEQEEAPEEIKRKEMPDLKEVLGALTDLLAQRARREARKGKDEMPSMHEVMNALSDLLSEKEKEEKRSPKRARRG